MKTWMAVGLAALGMMLGACNGPLPAWQDPNYPLQVSVSDTTLQGQVRVSVVKPERFGVGQLRVPVNVYNTTGGDLRIDYTYWFTDGAGRQTEQPLTQHETLPPRGYRQLVVQSLGAAEDFRVYLRPAP
jgi:hypothetical protein